MPLPGIFPGLWLWKLKPLHICNLPGESGAPDAVSLKTPWLLGSMNKSASYGCGAFRMKLWKSLTHCTTFHNLRMNKAGERSCFASPPIWKAPSLIRSRARSWWMSNHASCSSTVRWFSCETLKTIARWFSTKTLGLLVGSKLLQRHSPGWASRKSWGLRPRKDPTPNGFTRRPRWFMSKSSWIATLCSLASGVYLIGFVTSVEGQSLPLPLHRSSLGCPCATQYAQNPRTWGILLCPKSRPV